MAPRRAVSPPKSVAAAKKSVKKTKKSHTVAPAVREHERVPEVVHREHERVPVEETEEEPEEDPEDVEILAHLESPPRRSRVPVEQFRRHLMRWPQCFQ